MMFVNIVSTFELRFSFLTLIYGYYKLLQAINKVVFSAKLNLTMFQR